MPKTLANIRRDFRINWPVYLILLPVIIYFITFAYRPMVGLLMAFQNFNIKAGIWGSKWIGLQNFTDFFGSVFFWRLIRNTFLLSFYDLLINFPAPIIFALLLNEVRNKAFKKTVQTISYMPYFISTVVICGLILDFFSSRGAMTQIISALGGPSGNLMGMEDLFRPIFVGTNLWQGIGFSSIIYIAALTGIDQELYEAAVLDGANRLKQTWHITLPGIAPTIIILFILRMGSILNVAFEKVILLYSPATYETADVISSYVYRIGLMEFRYGYSTAVGLFNSVISLVIIVISNAISRKFSETSLF